MLQPKWSKKLVLASRLKMISNLHNRIYSLEVSAFFFDVCLLFGWSIARVMCLLLISELSHMRFCSQTMDKKFAPNWHCIMGGSLGFEVIPCSFRSLCLVVDNIWWRWFWFSICLSLSGGLRKTLSFIHVLWWQRCYPPVQVLSKLIVLLTARKYHQRVARTVNCRGRLPEILNSGHWHSEVVENWNIFFPNNFGAHSSIFNTHSLNIVFLGKSVLYLYLTLIQWSLNIQFYYFWCFFPDGIKEKMPQGPQRK